jgi:hypothetical protein
MNEQQLAAVKLALEALEMVAARTGARWALEQGYAGHLEAITTLQSIISQDALDKKAENARELGLDYELALMQQPATLDEMHAIGNGIMYGEQPAPVQEPRARLMTYIGKGPYPKPGYTVARTYEECPENQYPDAWEEGENLYTTPPAQPAVQVAWMYESVCGNDFAIRHDPPDYAKNIRPLYITPPAAQPVPVKTYHDGKPWPVAPKPWVGLTDEEIMGMYNEPRSDAEMIAFGRELEAKLKGKNSK